MIKLLPGVMILLLAVVSAHLYQTVFAICNVPIQYSIGTFDERFSITREEAVLALERAEMVWEAPHAYELFIYEEQSPFVINFIYDERQARLEEEIGFRTRLDVAEGVNQEIRAQYEGLTEEYDLLKKQFEAEKSSYEVRLQAYNETVDQYNTTGGAPDDVYEQLQAEQYSLDTLRQEINTMTRSLNQLVDEINHISNHGNELVAQYNRGVGEYNNAFGESRQFTQGDYRGDHINIYSFHDTDELSLIVAHEFGHALGIGHVEGGSSIMHYLIGEQPKELSLSEFDKEAFQEVCTPVSKWDRIFSR